MSERRRGTTWRTGAARRAGGARVGDRDPGADGRPEVLRPVRPLAAHDAAGERVRRVGLRRGARLRRLLDPRLAGDLRVGHAADARPDERDPRPVHRGADALAHLRDPRPAHRRGYDATRGSSRSAPRRTCARRGSPTPRTSAPSASSSSSTRSRTTLGPNHSHYAVDSAEGTGTPASPGSATRSARRRATSRRRRTTRCTTCARGWC